MPNTIYDVARLAGVSHTSVSAVLNNKPIRMREETRQRILDAVSTLGYQPNRVAQQLSTGKFSTIGLYFAVAGAYVFSSWNTNEMVAGIVHGASENMLSVLFAPTKRVYTFQEVVSSIASHGIDAGIIIGPIPLAGNDAKVVNGCGVRLVCIDSHPGLGPASTVDADNCLGMKIGVESLVAAGHKKMAYIGPTPDFQCLSDRMRGYYQAINDSGLPLADQIMHVVPEENVAAIVRQIAETSNGPTALVCAEESFARAALDEILRLELNLPCDIAVLSYDYVLNHPLTDCISVVHNDFFGTGIVAVETLVKVISGECSTPVAIRTVPEIMPPAKSVQKPVPGICTVARY